MKTLFLEPSHVNSLITNYNGYVVDSCDGCLLDNLVIEFNNSLLFCFEHYVNSCISDIEAVLVNNTDRDNVNNLWNRFYSLV